MSTFVAVNTYTHSVTYVTDNILRSLQDIVRLSGLDPARIADDWTVLERGISTWIESKHLETIVLEVYNPSTGCAYWTLGYRHRLRVERRWRRALLG